MSTPLLEVHDLKKHFPVRAGFLGGVTGYVYAVDGISFSIAKGETLSLVGESGCGKSTVGKAILRLFDITGGQVTLDGTRIDDMPASTLRRSARTGALATSRGIDATAVSPNLPGTFANATCSLPEVAKEWPARSAASRPSDKAVTFWCHWLLATTRPW